MTVLDKDQSLLQVASVKAVSVVVDPTSLDENVTSVGEGIIASQIADVSERNMF